MTDIVERLRESAARFHPKDFLHEAADEIERLRLVLEKIAWMDEFLDEAGTRAMIGIARAALSSHEVSTNKEGEP